MPLSLLINWYIYLYSQSHSLLYLMCAIVYLETPYVIFITLDIFWSSCSSENIL